jgi:PEGA domain-containing protein
MRSVVATASLVGALSLGLVSVAAAQEPEQQPAPPPASRQVAVPRGERIVTRDSESKRPDRSGENRAPAGRVRAPETATNQPAQPETETASQGDRRRPPATSASTVTKNDGGDTERRGAVRRPPPSADGSQSSRDHAVPRTNPPYNGDRGYAYPDYRYYNHYYDPWGYGAFALGFYYWPWGWSPGYYGYGGYGGGYGYSSGYVLGSLKLKVRPRDAEVFVDGYFAGTVDDFDGIFQALKLDRGAYRIEIRKPGYTTLQYDIRVQPDHTLTIRGEMKPEP